MLQVTKPRSHNPGIWPYTPIPGCMGRRKTSRELQVCGNRCLLTHLFIHQCRLARKQRSCEPSKAADSVFHTFAPVTPGAQTKAIAKAPARRNGVAGYEANALLERLVESWRSASGKLKPGCPTDRQLRESPANTRSLLPHRSLQSLPPKSTSDDILRNAGECS